MKDWLKDRPIFQMMVNAILTLIVMLIVLKATNSQESEKELKNKIENKADITYVDKQDNAIKESIKSTESLFLYEIQELRKDLRLKQDKD